MKRELLTLVVALALIGTVFAGSATAAQASPVLSTGDAVDSIFVQPADNLDSGGGGGDTCSISPTDNLDSGGGGC